MAIVEGRGSARGEIGLASISLSSPTLILCQFSDTRTYVRTLTKLAIFNPSEILVSFFEIKYSDGLIIGIIGESA